MILGLSLMQPELFLSSELRFEELGQLKRVDRVVIIHQRNLGLDDLDNHWALGWGTCHRLGVAGNSGVGDRNMAELKPGKSLGFIASS